MVFLFFYLNCLNYQKTKFKAIKERTLQTEATCPLGYQLCGLTNSKILCLKSSKNCPINGLIYGDTSDVLPSSGGSHILLH
jgi:hypothetical protein